MEIEYRTTQLSQFSCENFRLSVWCVVSMLVSALVLWERSICCALAYYGGLAVRPLLWKHFPHRTSKLDISKERIDKLIFQNLLFSKLVIANVII